MDNPFERRATEQVRNEEAFLALISPDPISTYLGKYGASGQLYDRLVIILGTPGSGKTTMAKLFEYPMVAALLRNSASQSHRALLTALAECSCIGDGRPTVVAARLSLESDYREIWEFPYTEDFRDGLLKALLQARTVLAWFRHLQRTGISAVDVEILTTGGSHAATEAIGGTSGDKLVSRAQEVESEIYRIVGALIPPSPDELGKAVTEAYRPFDVVDRLIVPFGGNGKRIELRPLVAFDDAHALHPTQFRNLSRWLVRRELRVARWVMTRFDVLPADEAIGVILAGNTGEVELPGITTAREITQIALQSAQDRREQRSQFRRMAKDMANRYLSQMPEFSTRKLGSLDALLPNEPEHLTASKVADLRAKLDAMQNRLRITDDRRRRLQADVDDYKPTGGGLGEDDRLAMLAILMHRYAKRIPQTGLFQENSDPEPARPLAVDGSVFEAARLQLFHSYDRAYYFGIDDLCDASSENAEQFLRLAAILVDAIATRLIRGRPASLRSGEQNQLLRERAGSFIRDWNFPHFDYVQTLVELIAKRCLSVSLEPNAWIGAGANAYGVPQQEFEGIYKAAPDLSRTLKYAVAYNAITLVPKYECKNKLWCLLELGGIPKVHYGLTLKRGGFIEGTLDELKTYNRNTG
jgi:hypothetical protein